MGKSWKIALILLCSLPSISLAQTLNVAVASNFISPFKTLKREFEKNSSIQIVLISGSSGKLAAQIKHGAPYDIFLSADQKRVENLLTEGLAVKQSRTSYARGKLALFAPKSSLRETSIKTFFKNNIQHLALANPKLAPYGRAAKEVLLNLSLWKSLRKKFVFGENISQTYQFLATGAADIGLVAYSQVKQQQKKATYKLVPQKWHSPIIQESVILKSCGEKRAAKKFLHFMKSHKGREIIQSYGYQTKPPTPKRS